MYLLNSAPLEAPLTLDASVAQRGRGTSVGAGMFHTSAEAERSPNPMVGLSSLLLRAHLQCIVGGARLGLKATRRIGRSQLQIIDHLTATETQSANSEHVLRTVIDDVRGCLRGIGEDASVEMTRLGAELGKLDAEARGMGVESRDPHQAYQRRWKVKP
jgi:hypothetical protein